MNIFQFFITCKRTNNANNATLYPSDPMNHLCSLTGKKISENCFTYRSIQIFKILFQGFILQNLILRKRLRGTGFITPPRWVFYFHHTTLVWWK